jgi:hypothetical protein
MGVDEHPEHEHHPEARVPQLIGVLGFSWG